MPFPKQDSAPAVPASGASLVGRSHWLRRLAPFLLAHRRKVFLALGGTLVGQIANLAIPVLQKVVVDDVIVAGSAPLAPWIALMVLSATIAVGATILRRANGNSFGFAVQHDLRDAVFRQVQRLDIGYSSAGQALSTGDVISRSTADITLVQTLFSQLHVLLGSLIIVVGAAVVMAVLSPLLSLVMLACLPVLWLVARGLRLAIFPAVWADQHAHARLAGIIEENTSGVRVVRAFGQEQRELTRFVDAAGALYGSRLRTIRINARYAPLMQVVPGVAQLGVLAFGGCLAWSGAISAGTFLAFFSYLVQLLAPVRTLSGALTTIQQARAGAERIFELLDLRPAVVEATDAVPLRAGPGRVEMRGIGFSHTPDHQLLDSLDLTIEPGETVAVVGGSGTGKTSLALLLVRFQDPQKGQVLIDGQDIAGVTLGSLRRSIGMVFEEAFLFAGTVAANIARGRPEASHGDIERAARIAGAHEFIVGLAQGYDTPVAELGATLSGGQRQRLTIARAVLTDPRVLVLDDATSALDGLTEAGVLQALRTVLSGRTTLVVARRRSTIDLADRVVLLENGRIAASGTHEELYAVHPSYRRLIDSAPDAEPLARTDIPAGDGVDARAWPNGMQAVVAERELAFTETVTAGGFGARRSLPSNAALSIGLDGVRSLAAALPPAYERPDVDVDAETGDRQPFSLSRFVKPYGTGLLFGLALVVADTLLGLAGPALIGVGVEGVVQQSATMLFYALAGFGAVLAASWLVGRGLALQTSRTAERLLYALRTRIFAKLQRLPIERYEQESAGHIMARATTDVEALSALLQQGLLYAVVGLATCGGILAALIVVEPKLALAAAPVLPVLVIGTEWFRRASAHAYERSRKRVATVYAGIQEGLAGARVTRALASEARTADTFRAESDRYRSARVQAARISAIYFPSLQFLSVVAKALVLVAGAGLAARGEVGIGVLIAFLLYLDQFFSPIQQLSQVFDQWLQATTSLRRISGLLSEPAGLTLPAAPLSPTDVAGRLAFDDVSFSYAGAERVALSHVSFIVPPGQRLAIAGRTGAGKTTLARLMARFSDPASGRILIDGHDLAAIEPGALRRIVGYVPQEPVLFAASVAHNIAYGRPDASPRQIEAAARQVGAHGFIRRLPDGYHTVVAERGRSLSAGQRQLICLARALLVDPTILILDEATAQVDHDAEALIAQALECRGSNRTVIVIAHRLQTVLRADRVLVLDHGRIVQDDPPRDLLAKEGLFKVFNAVAERPRDIQPPANQSSQPIPVTTLAS